MAVDPTGGVAVPDDPNMASGPDPIGEQILSEAFPHLPDPISRDPRDITQPLVPPQPTTNSETATTDGNQTNQRQGGAKRVLSFSNPQRGNFSYRRRRPDVSFLRKVVSEL